MARRKVKYSSFTVLQDKKYSLLKELGRPNLEIISRWDRGTTNATARNWAQEEYDYDYELGEGEDVRLNAWPVLDEVLQCQYVLRGSGLRPWARLAHAKNRGLRCLLLSANVGLA